MAITINQNPDVFTPAYNDIVFVVTSTNKAQSNFKYIADVVVQGQPTKRMKLSPHPTYGSAAFNVGRVIESFVNSDISKTAYGFQQNLSSYIDVRVQFGEEYGPSSGTTIYPNLTTASPKYPYNAEFDFLAFKNYAQSDWLMAAGSTKSFLTDMPSSGVIRDSEYAWLHCMTQTSGTIYYANVITFNTVGTIIGNYKVENPYQAQSSINDKFVRFGCGTANLNLIPSSGITNVVGIQPIINSNVDRYTINFINYAGTITSETRGFKVKNDCTKNTTYRFHFLNEKGGFDSFTFIRGSTKSVEITRSKYKKVTGGLTSATAYGYSKSDRGDIQYNTSLKDTFKVKSDWISESESVWLEQLITSPEVYLDDATHGLVAVNITNSNYSIKQTAQDKLFNLDIEFEYSFNRYRQRG